jgi:LysR family transcriptional activator of nhaA
MEWINYHHLLYFWTAAREGSISAAGEKLHLAQPTLSSQIKKLEKSLGAALFERRGRGLKLTEEGQTVYRYADEIFNLGRELSEVLQGRESSDRITLTVGVPDVLPKLVVYRLLRPALALPTEVRLITYEGKLETLLSELALHKLDVVLSETPLDGTARIRAFHHLLGECHVSFLAIQELAEKYRDNFPQSLAGAPMLLPTQNTVARRALDQWFDERQIHPRIVHEFEDSALLKVFGQAGTGIFPVPSAIAAETCNQYHVTHVGEVEELKERYYAISIDRRLKHPAVIALHREARRSLFA